MALSGWCAEVVGIDDIVLERLRRLLAGRSDVVEKPMVGGRSFSVGGRMCCGVTQRGLMVRVGRDGVAPALKEPHVSRMSMGDRPLAAFVIVAPPGVAADELLASWVERGSAAAARVGGVAAKNPGVRGSRRRATESSPSAAAGSATERFAELVEHFADNADVTLPEPGSGRGFGSSALKVNGSIFAMLTRGELVVKLPAARVAELIEGGTGVSFAAGKRSPMSQWVTVTVDEASTWLALTREALAFVAGR